MLKKTLNNGVRVESMELTEHQFERACTLLVSEFKTGCYDSLSPSDQYLEAWLSDDMASEIESSKWLKTSVEKGAEIYTYKDGWQDIGEIAVFKN